MGSISRARPRRSCIFNNIWTWSATGGKIVWACMRENWAIVSIAIINLQCKVLSVISVQNETDQNNALKMSSDSYEMWNSNKKYQHFWIFYKVKKLKQLKFDGTTECLKIIQSLRFEIRFVEKYDSQVDVFLEYWLKILIF